MFRTLLFIALLSCLPITAEADASTDPLAYLQHYRDTRAALRTGDPAALIESAQQVLAQVPDHAMARFFLAHAHAQQAHHDAAATELARLADQGLTLTLANIPAFATLAESEQYAPLRQRLTANRAPRGRSETVYDVALPRYVPEGLALAADGETLLLGSVHLAKIVEVGADNRSRDWVSSGRDGLCSVLSLRFSDDHQQLYAATACMQQTAGITEEQQGNSGIFVYAPDGRLLASHWVPRAATEPAQHVLGEVLVRSEHQLLTSDSLGGAIYQLDLRSGDYTEIVTAGTLPNPQGMALSADGNGLYIADYQAGIMYLELASGALQRLQNSAFAAIHGIDGLARCNDTLVAIQNGTRPHRILALQLDATARNIQYSTVLAQGLAEWDEPTVGIVDSERLLYVANSHWPHFDDQGRLPEEPLDGPRIMSLAIPGCNR